MLVMAVLTPKSDFIDWDSRIPKYRQVVNTILWEIDQELVRPGQRLPSLTETSAEYYLSRDTIGKAYKELTQLGVITSVPGKGYFVNKRSKVGTIKVLLVVNKLSHYKSQLYEALVARIGNRAAVTVYTHNYDVRLFQCCILENLAYYDYFLVLPHFHGDEELMYQTLEKIPRNKLLILDRKLPLLEGKYGLIYQEFREDMKAALYENCARVQQYTRFSLVLPPDCRHLQEIAAGFEAFCREIGQAFAVLKRHLLPADIRQGEAYLTIRDQDLKLLVSAAQQNHWRPGTDVGILTYNDSPLKEVLANGISVVCTDHEQMGQTAAQMMIGQKMEQVHNPFRFIDRHSL
jgi:DNA-binding transcriptional regulator YhcF (GntR family)